MSNQLPDREMIDRLRQIHKAKGDRGPIAIDSRALGRIQRMMEKRKPGHRHLILPQTPSELSPGELSDAVAAIVSAGATARRHGDALMIESTRPLDREKIPVTQAVAGDLWKLLDRSCPRCKSTSIQAQSYDRPPGWRLVCRCCGSTVRRPRF